MPSSETADLFLQINDAVYYTGHIAIAIYFLAPLGQGEFATAKQRFLQYGVPLLILVALSKAFALKWSIKQLLRAANLDPDFGFTVASLIANILALGWLIRAYWRLWRDGRMGW